MAANVDDATAEKAADWITRLVRTITAACGCTERGCYWHAQFSGRHTLFAHAVGHNGKRYIVSHAIGAISNIDQPTITPSEPISDETIQIMADEWIPLVKNEHAIIDRQEAARGDSDAG